MCRGCGSIVGAGESTCAVCGASAAVVRPAQSPTLPDRETVRFARALFYRSNKFTIVLLVLNLFVFLLMWESSGLTTATLFNGFPEPVLIAYGAKLNSLIHSPYREWWRFVTPMFVHINVMHLLVNMYSLWIIGPYVEKLYGSAKFVVIWVLTGIAGVLASYLTLHPSLATTSLGRFLFKSQDVPSAGASGALFGLVGVLFIFGIKYRHELPGGFKRVFGTGMIPVIAINLFIGYLGRGFIDNAAHLGGLISGAALAGVIGYRRVGDRAAINVTWRVLQVIALLLVAVCFFKTGKKLKMWMSTSESPTIVIQKPSAFLIYVSVMSQAQEKVSAIITEQDQSNTPTVLTNLTAVQPPDAVAAQLRDRLQKILTAAVGLDQKASTNVNQPGPRRVDQKLTDEFNAWRKDYEAWLKGAVAANQVQ